MKPRISRSLSAVLTVRRNDAGTTPERSLLRVETVLDILMSLVCNHRANSPSQRFPRGTMRAKLRAFGALILFLNLVGSADAIPPPPPEPPRLRTAQMSVKVKLI